MLRVALIVALWLSWLKAQELLAPSKHRRVWREGCHGYVPKPKNTLDVIGMYVCAADSQRFSLPRNLLPLFLILSVSAISSCFLLFFLLLIFLVLFSYPWCKVRYGVAVDLILLLLLLLNSVNQSIWLKAVCLRVRVERCIAESLM